MTAPARLLALRLQGFKSFAERTVVEFGPGISAIVGPNGSGKSNLADALRWALGEQGRSLRTRRAEDVIWAGSDRRAAQGMADVTLVLDNSDGLLPVDFSVLELGRRLYRSGENDYLLNKQRVRLRDMVDLLDAAHLADNAFLFIGQGMVDQALALRPEERRPLFEEVAGVRRHERRRRRSEDQLAESLANVARLEDILIELRPQARRLAAQAEQQASRQSAAEDLVEAILASAHMRWHDAASRVAAAVGRRARTRLDADRAMADLTGAEEQVAAFAARLAQRAATERARRASHDEALGARTSVNLRLARLTAEGESLVRDRARVADELARTGAALEIERRALAIPAPTRDDELQAALADAERALVEAAAELGTLRSADRARGDELAAIGRAEVARSAELESARRRLAEADRRAAIETAGAGTAAARVSALEEALSGARRALGAATESERRAATEREEARLIAETTDAERTAAHERLQSQTGALAARRGRLDALRERLAEEETRGIAHAARRRGGRRLDEELVVDPALRAAVGAALSDVARAYLVSRSAVGELGGERGILVVVEPGPLGARQEVRGSESAERRIRDLVAARGGGMLDQALRRDPVGGARRLLARAAWLPTLADCVDLQPDLPPGWLAVSRDGEAVVTDLTVVLGTSDGTLERRAEVEGLAVEVAGLEAQSAAAGTEAHEAGRAATAAREALHQARAAESAASAARRRAEEGERQAARAVEVVARELEWQRAQTVRLGGESDRLRTTLSALEAQDTAAGSDPPGTRIVTDQAGPGVHMTTALGTWDQRAMDLRERRDRLAEQVARDELDRRAAEGRRARAEATVAIHDERLSRLDAEVGPLADRERALEVAREALGREAAQAASLEAALRQSLDELLAADGLERGRLASAERDATAARERLRAAEEGARAADRVGLEADLGLDALREQLLVDLAGLGEIALRYLPAAEGNAAARLTVADHDGPAADEAVEVEIPEDGARLEARLAIATRRWAAEPPDGVVLGAARLGLLRRRFHELGAANPYALEEYRSIRARLDDLDAQRADLSRAIERTRQLIDELSTLIANQFRTTFRALEGAFDRRFQQLFGGGFAHLELTDPTDLGATGVEIIARPPGKKKQPLAMLSGGERSLTAVALLLAMLEVRPVPFCVLDEVDAALDEANVGRFTAALRALAEKTQFVVITHNRETIRAADALYGVTVGDDLVSRVISLRLDEAHSIAARQQGDPLVDAPAG